MPRYGQFELCSMFMVNMFVGLCVALCVVQVLAVPQTITSPPPSTVTLYGVIPSPLHSLLANTSNTMSADGTFQLAATILGVEVDSDGSITGSVAYYVHVAVTLVESSGGEWETVSPHITTDVHGQIGVLEGQYISCSYDSGHQSAQCTGLDLDPVLATVTSGSQLATVTEVETSTEEFEGSITRAAVLTLAVPTTTGSSNGALPGSRVCYELTGIISPIAVVFALSLW
ncbi:hypothetical protein D9757_009914 [Collybiopsis confluens]|uniref:Uncharacterized protein n=1 Tax=Collybiopsis confluens TaxID=2823264 RepID=A0A8H5LWZ0_9AGAR|nr:hypothetical protein D9757_009914 [Collybiopsis confluens]